MNKMNNQKVSDCPRWVVKEGLPLLPAPCLRVECGIGMGAGPPTTTPLHLPLPSL